jgi:hypothetical protein
MGATGTHSEYVIIIAFPRQQLLRECAAVLRLYVHYLSVTYFLHSNIWTAWTIFCPSPYNCKIIIIRSQGFQTARGVKHQVVFDLLSEKGMCHVQCNVSLLVSETADKKCGKENGFRSLSLDNFSLSRENHFSAHVCHVFFWVAFFRADFLS